MNAVKESAAIESTLAAIASHPTRVEAFMVLAERTASPKDLQLALGKPLGHVAYHVRELAKLGAVEVVDERPVRGAVEHFYKAVERPFADGADWEGLTPAERAAVSRHILQLHVADTSVALEKGTFDARPERALIRFPMVVDESGWIELKDLHTEMYERTLEIQARSNGRRAENSDDPGIATMATCMFFEMPERD